MVTGLLTGDWLLLFINTLFLYQMINSERDYAVRRSSFIDLQRCSRFCLAELRLIECACDMSSNTSKRI